MILDIVMWLVFTAVCTTGLTLGIVAQAQKRSSHRAAERHETPTP